MLGDSSWKPFGRTNSRRSACRIVLFRTITRDPAGTSCGDSIFSGTRPWVSSCGFHKAAPVSWPSTSGRARQPSGNWAGAEASAENRKQAWAPTGFARGFCVLSEVAEIQYKCTGIYSSKGESGIRWNDPAVGIQWPPRSPILSEKYQEAQTLAEWIASTLADHFVFGKRLDSNDLQRVEPARLSRYQATVPQPETLSRGLLLSHSGVPMR